MSDQLIIIDLRIPDLLIYEQEKLRRRGMRKNKTRVQTWRELFLQTNAHFWPQLVLL